jgi:6-pyruvoyltetrahydropterin/6-carboxytetrahydropterin synthase
MKGLIPTTENLAIGIWNELKEKIHGGALFSVRISETENNFFEYRGD